MRGYVVRVVRLKSGRGIRRGVFLVAVLVLSIVRVEWSDQVDEVDRRGGRTVGG